MSVPLLGHPTAPTAKKHQTSITNMMSWNWEYKICGGDGGGKDPLNLRVLDLAQRNTICLSIPGLDVFLSRI